MNETATIDLHGRLVGPGQPPLLIAEIGQAHDGSLGTAHAYIDAVANSGAEAIKFQTHIASAESTPHEKFRVRVFPQDATRYDYWKRMEFTEEQWAGLAEHAREKKVIFLSTAFSNEAVDLLSRLNVPAWKIGSGEISNLSLIERVARTKAPVLLSSGMSSWAELDDAVAVVRQAKAPLAIFQCTTSYPCPPELVGLNIVSELRNRYRCPVGLSDHSGTIFASLAAITLGASIIEVHTVFSKEAFGPDVTASVTTSELRQLSDGMKFLHQAHSNPIDKDQEADARSELKTLFGKSVVAAKPIVAGSTLTKNDLALKKPGTGVAANRLQEIVGRTTRVSYQTDDFIVESDLD